MFILGFHGGRRREDEEQHSGFEMHDSAAVLLEDGVLVAAVEEERLNRIKHSNHFPARAIRFCLSRRQLSLQDVDFIATNFEESVVDFWAQLDLLDDARTPNPTSGRQMLGALFAHEFGVDVSAKLRFCKHHLAHAWSAYAPSGFDRSLVLVLDGEGDNRSGMVLQSAGGELTVLREFDLSQSLGEFYTQTIKLLGYNRFDEYKVMGLAPYGDATVYAPLFERCYRLLPDGGYQLENPLTWFGCFEQAGLLKQARRKGEPFTQTHKDLAAALQLTLERIVLHILTHFRQTTGLRKLCLAGGVAHNCTLNGKALYSGLFEQVYVQPAAHDAGGALGAALSVWQDEAKRAAARPKAFSLPHLFWGTDCGNDSAIERTLARWQGLVSYEWLDNCAAQTARLLADGAVVGWVQGRSEFGPRALGNRSILADPRPAENKQLINQMVKKREGYRPFAPSVLAERVAEFFVVPPEQRAFPFMIFVLDVVPERRAELGAITHVDGTARVQTVDRATNPRYWELIHAFGELTGVPLLLNTSFNNNVEPIVDSVEEALTCFLTTGIHYLVIGNFLVRKPAVLTTAPAWAQLVPQLPPGRRLVKRWHKRGAGQLETVWEVESLASRFFGQPTVAVSAETFALLEAANGKHTLAQLCAASGLADEQRAAVWAQLLTLWEQRAVTLRPVAQDLASLLKQRLKA